MVLERFESALWQTTSLLLADGDEAVVIDPAVSADEVARIAARARELGARVTHVLATHADWDHVCGVAAFPAAAATVSEATAARLLARAETATTAERAAAHGVEIAGEPRVDRTFPAGAALRAGPFLLETLALSGHTPDGTAFRCRELDLLAVGDHLSAIEFPFVTSTAAYRGTLAALIDLLRRDPPGRVVPGHGPELTAAEALTIAEADLAYLWELHDAVARGTSREEARAAALAVDPPRPADDSDEARSANVEAALAERFADPALVHELAEQPFRTDIEYYEGRAHGIATVNGVSLAAARADVARRHGLSGWTELTRRVQALASGEEPPTPFMLAYRAVEDGDVERLRELLDAHPELVRQRGTNGNDLFGMARDRDLVRLLLERGADVSRGNDYGWTKLHQAGYGNDRALAELLLAAGARTDLDARGDGGTPLIVALFWGHREVVELLGLEPRNLRVAAGLGLVGLIDELAGTPAAGAHRGFYRPHGGFPAWQPSDDPQEILDEALVWAAKSDRVEAIERLVELGADLDADPYRGTPLTWAACNGRVAAIRRLVDLGADVNARGTFGGPDHGEGVTALHLAAQSGRAEAVEALLELGADPTVRDALHDGTPAGWARHGRHPELARLLG